MQTNNGSKNSLAQTIKGIWLILIIAGSSLLLLTSTPQTQADHTRFGLAREASKPASLLGAVSTNTETPIPTVFPVLMQVTATVTLTPTPTPTNIYFPGSSPSPSTTPTNTPPNTATPTPGQQATATVIPRPSLYVAQNGNDSNPCRSETAACKTIGAAISKARDSETISILPGTYQESLVLTRSLNLVGQGIDKTFLDGASVSTVISISQDVTVKIFGVTIQKGQSATQGGGIYNLGHLTLTSSVLQENLGEDGGGLYNGPNEGGVNSARGFSTLNNCTFSKNQATGSGGSIQNEGLLRIENSTFSENTAADDGGAIINTGNLTLRKTTLQKNSAGTSGGAIRNNGGTVTVEQSSIQGNKAGSIGGGIINNFNTEWLLQGTLTFSESVVSNNGAELGGGIANISSTLTLLNSTLDNNQAGGSGGGLFNAGGQADLTDSTLRNNQASAGTGGGITNAIGSFESTLSGLSADNVLTGTVILTRSILSGNTASAEGGGIVNGGILQLTDSMVNGNSSKTDGGGLVNTEGGKVTSNRSTFSQNKAAGHGGGFLNDRGIATLSNTTVSGNSATGGYGGGLKNNLGQVKLLNVTISDNTAKIGGGGVLNETGSTLLLQNTIIAANTSEGSLDPDCFGALTSEGYNLVGINQAGCNFFRTSGDQEGLSNNPLNPFLGPLQNNGGSTLTQGLLPGSTALDAGNNNACPSTDQRGFPRQGATCDLGAYEAGLATRLLFNRQPGDTLTETTFPQSPRVAAVDNLGNVGVFNSPVTLALKKVLGAETALLKGPSSVKLSQGQATFSDLTISEPGGYQLLATAPGLPSAESAAFNITTLAETKPREVEDNNLPEEANHLHFSREGHAEAKGLITPQADADWFVFLARPYSKVEIELSDLPADYDLALVADPFNSKTISDSIDFSNLTDGVDVDLLGQVRSATSLDADDRVNLYASFNILNRIIALSTNDLTDTEKIEATLPTSGRYYILVYSADGDSEATKPYELDLHLEGGTLEEAALEPSALGGLALPNKDLPQPYPPVKTLFFYHKARLLAKYPTEAAEIGQLTTLLQQGSGLLTASQGLALDLSGPQILPADAAKLTALYSQWDAAPASPLNANAVAQQIWYLLDQLLQNYYPAVNNLVLVGGDDIIPFYRVPDETMVSNERDYFTSLAADQASLLPNSPLAGALQAGYIQTDNFYADRQPTLWRGRSLYVPDLGIGRLVERPADMVRYLTAYSSQESYVVQADRQEAGHAGAAMVTGYSFVKDAAEGIVTQLQNYGFKVDGNLGTTYRVEKSLIGDSWTLDQLTKTWFNNQLGQLKASYSNLNTPYHFVSLNGHFSHNELDPADLTSNTFAATSLLAPTVKEGNETSPYFKNGTSASLLYSIGCHAGLSASDLAFPSDKASFQADFPSAILKQGGNWLGSSSFSYGEDKLVGYSERLALLFTQQLGLAIKDGQGNYIGASIGDSLARAKRLYLQTNGPGGFSIYDEKVILGLTFYGLPFIRVKVPNPTPPTNGGTFDPLPQTLPSALEIQDGLFTRVITLTNTFTQGQADVNGSMSLGVTSKLLDNFASQPVSLTGLDQMAPGRPILPVLTYDITLQPNPLGKNQAPPEPRGVRFRSAKALPTLPNFNPQVTSALTQQVYLQQDPLLLFQGAWLPDLPFSFQRTTTMSGETKLIRDTLLVSPAQFKALNNQTGLLRRFSQLVLEIIYLDPLTAAPEALPRRSRPGSAKSGSRRQSAALLQAAPAQLSNPVLLSRAVVDKSGLGIREVSVTYTVDDLNWQRIPLNDLGENLYQAEVVVPTGQQLSAFFEVMDNAGNVAVNPPKGTLQNGSLLVMLPLIVR